jgi:hypothetical protein
MPRALKKIPRREDRVEKLDTNLRLCLCEGKGFWDFCGLVTKRDWLQAWQKHGAALLADYQQNRPGTRPTAMRCAGLLEPRRLVKPLPDRHNFYITPVLHEATGETTEHVSGMCRFLQCEADQLLKEGAISAAEHKRHFDEGIHESACMGARL